MLVRFMFIIFIQISLEESIVFFYFKHYSFFCCFCFFLFIIETKSYTLAVHRSMISTFFYADFTCPLYYRGISPLYVINLNHTDTVIKNFNKRLVLCPKSNTLLYSMQKTVWQKLYAQ